MKEKMKSIIESGTRKKIMYCGVVILCLMVLGFAYIDNKLAVVEVAEFEVGDIVRTTPEDYLSDMVSDKVRKGTVNVSDILNDKNFVYDKENQTIVSKDKNYLDIGEYTFTFKFKDKVATTIIKVKDTKAPIIHQKEDKLSFGEGSKIDFAKYFEAKDFSNVNLTFDSSKVDFNKAGDYQATVFATDESGNKSQKQFDVQVAEWPKVHQDDGVSITIYKEWYHNAYVYAAHVQLKDYKRFGTECGNGRYGGMETTSHMSKRMNAIFGMNGSYSAPYLGYGVVRSGKVYNNKQCNLPGVYGTSTGILSSSARMGYNGSMLSTLAKQGKVTDTFCFGPEFNTGIGMKDRSRAQRTFIGSNEKPGDMWLCVSDGRKNDGVSSGLTYKQCWDYLKSKGCTFGAPLDGGGSSTMYFKGKVLNAERGHERKVVDHVYIK